MTLPAILRQNVPGYKARAAQQRVRELRRAGADNERAGSASGSSSKAATRMGKRKQRRWENGETQTLSELCRRPADPICAVVANFHGAAVTRPKPSDYSICQLNTHPSFPSPPPSTFYPYRPVSTSDPSSSSNYVFDDTKAADFGRFSLPIKGLKKSTRRIVVDGGPGQEIVETVDNQMRGWLDGAHIFLKPDGSSSSASGAILLDLEGHGQSSSDEPTIVQVSRLPHSLIWSIQDPFVRFLVHAIARYYRVVSFTKSDPSSSADRRLVYLLRPNMPARTLDPATMPKQGLETPPSTEWEASSVMYTGNSSDDTPSSAAETASLLSSDDADAESLLGSEADSVDGHDDGNETVQAIPMADLSIADTTAVRQSQSRPSYLARPSLPDIESDPDSGAEIEYSTDDDVDSVLSGSIDEDALRSSAARIVAVRQPIGTACPARPVHLEQQELIEPLPRALLPTAKTINNAKSKAAPGRQGGRWRMPEATFSEWVLAR